MASKSRLLLFTVFTVFSILSSNCLVRGEEETEPKEAVLTLDSSNFEETISKSSFIAVEFYAPWCGHCQQLAPEWEEAASVLQKEDPPLILAKFDADAEANRELTVKYEIQGYPTIKIFRDGGKSIEDYKGRRDAVGIVPNMKKLAGPVSLEIKSEEDAKNLITEKKVTIVGVFPELSGREFENFMAAAKKLRSYYDFCHTTDIKLLPKGDLEVKGPFVRLFKPFDELLVDTQDFDVQALQNFIDDASTPIVTTVDLDPSNEANLMKFFASRDSKVLFYVSHTASNFADLKSKLYEVAASYKGKNLRFLINDLNEDSKDAMEYFGVDQNDGPFIFIQQNDGRKYVKTKVQPDEIATFLNDYKEGNVKEHIKSEPIPEHNNEPVKKVVADNIKEFVNSGKNVLLEFYAPWCSHCKELAPILDEVAVALEKETDVVIAKMDATANDVPIEYEIEGYPTLIFSSASGKVSKHEGEKRTAEDIINFIKSNKEPVQNGTESPKDEL